MRAGSMVIMKIISILLYPINIYTIHHSDNYSIFIVFLNDSNGFHKLTSNKHYSKHYATLPLILSHDFNFLNLRLFGCINMICSTLSVLSLCFRNWQYFIRDVLNT